jgi:hypothetical protein
MDEQEHSEADSFFRNRHWAVGGQAHLHRVKLIAGLLEL